MKNTKLLASFLLIIISCTQEKKYDYPLIYTGEVTDINSSGAVFSAKIVDLSKENIIEYGFVWDSKSNPDIINSEKYVILDSPGTGVVSEYISTTLQKGVKYYVRAYIRNTDYITYGKEVTFTSLGSQAPILTNFQPQTGNLKDTIIIIGQNFSYKLSNNNVFFDEVKAVVIKANQDTLSVIVPNSLNSKSSIISVSISGNRVQLAGKFNLISPIINSFDAKIATFGSSVSIDGLYFMSNPTTLHVYFDDYEAKVIDNQGNRLIVTVPDSLNKRQCYIKVLMNNLVVFSTEKFQLESFSIYDFNPKIANTGNTITLTGNNFSPILKNNKVTIGGMIANVTKSTISELDVTLPLQNGGYYPSRNVKINVEVIEENADYIEPLLINDKWFRHKDSPFDFYGSFYAVVNDKAYLGINGNKGFWEFDPIANEFISLADFPGLSRYGGNGFAINNNIYFGTGNDINNNLKDFWEYNVLSNAWIQKSDFPGNPRTGSITFSINGNGYLGGGIFEMVDSWNNPFDDFWIYNSSTDQWSRIPSFMSTDSSSVEGMSDGIAIVAGDNAYMGLGWNFTAFPDGEDERWFVYNSITNSWKQLANFPKPRANENAIAFYLNGIPHIKTVESDFFGYNSSLNSWQNITTGLLPDNISGIGFSIFNIAYIGIGNALWEYDPSR
jgi:N-acetylneuraminic acid mutarotase